MSPITTHVLDTALGCPAGGLAIQLSSKTEGEWRVLAEGTTNADGRITDLLEPGALKAGDYRMVFDTGAYLKAAGRPVFYPQVAIDFRITAPEQHYHVPLLLAPFGYSTYRGS
ncbi:MAG: hydroxyisourate hydrolase [Nannocystaceae bacterium]|nr:hydroxyisourate hydrolase [Nannocystaceae bacterium]